MQLPALQLPQLCVLDSRCCGAFPSEVASLPQLQTLGCSSTFDSAWRVAVEHASKVVAAAPLASVESVTAGDGASVADAASIVPCAASPPASVNCENLPVHSETVLHILANDISTPTRGLTWRIYCKN